MLALVLAGTAIAAPALAADTRNWTPPAAPIYAQRLADETMKSIPSC